MGEGDLHSTPSFRLYSLRSEDGTVGGLIINARVVPGRTAVDLTGLNPIAASRARHVVQQAFGTLGLSFPRQRVVISVSESRRPIRPGDLDLPMALGLLVIMGVLPLEDLCGYCTFAGLSRDGRLLGLPDITAATVIAADRSLGMICASPQGDEIAPTDATEILAATDLLSLIIHFRGSQILSPPVRSLTGAHGQHPSPTSSTSAGRPS